MLPLVTSGAGQAVVPVGLAYETASYAAAEVEVLPNLAGVIGPLQLGFVEQNQIGNSSSWTSSG